MHLSFRSWYRLQPPKILVVEDSPTYLRQISNLLQETGYQTIAAIDGEQALEKAAREGPNLIILDIILPKKNGFHICPVIDYLVPGKQGGSGKNAAPRSSSHRQLPLRRVTRFQTHRMVRREDGTSVRSAPHLRRRPARPAGLGPPRVYCAFPTLSTSRTR